WVVEGHTAVPLFFVLSGFLLSLPWFRGEPVSPWRYLLNRALRILPLYLTIVAAALFITRTFPSPGRLWPYLTFTFTIPVWFNNPLGLGWLGNNLWSLCPEVGFYLLLPVLARLLPTARRLT